jgi:Na+/H+ antiporter NhaD/arsenite permease-like protein
MTDLQMLATFVVFTAVLLAVTANLMDMAVAAMLGVSVLIVFGIYNHQDILSATRSADGSLSLLFGGMVVARTLEPTGVFDHIGTRFLLLTGGSGKRFLLGLILLVAGLCAFLPNATTVILLAPVIIRICRQLEVDFVGPVVITAVASNSAGMLTLVGDPATFMVGSAIGLSFNQYLVKISLGGLVALLVLVPLLPVVLKDVWRVRRALPRSLAPEPIKRPVMCLFSLSVLAGMIAMFVLGEALPVQIVPPAVSIIGASLALLIVYSAKVEPIEHVLKDLDWKTLIFLFCMFCLVEALTKTGVVQGFALNMYHYFGTDLILVALAILAAVSLGSSVIANIPLVAAMLILIKGYFVIAELVPEEALGVDFTAWPAAYLPVFVAMMFAGTLGGNATLIGASANIVSAGICGAHGSPVSFVRFMRYGLPVTLVQIGMAALYVMALFYWIGR